MVIGEDTSKVSHGHNGTLTWNLMIMLDLKQLSLKFKVWVRRLCISIQTILRGEYQSIKSFRQGLIKSDSSFQWCSSFGIHSITQIKKHTQKHFPILSKETHTRIFNSSKYYSLVLFHIVLEVNVLSTYITFCATQKMMHYSSCNW